MLALLIGSVALVGSFVVLRARAAEPPEEIEELQQWVDEQGFNYTVAENWVTQLLPEEREVLCGYKHVEAPKEPLRDNIRFFSGVPTIETQKFTQPPAYDAMALGYVTPVKSQGVCGACWAFAAIADLESDVAIAESILPDFAEQEVGDCNIWSSVGGHNFCDGGIALMSTNFFTKYGTADETCHPYAETPQSCQDCPLLKNVDNWRMVTGSNGESQIATIKNAILAYGPVYSTIYASGTGFDAYSSGVYEYWGLEDPNHAIQIIGWDDSLPHSHGTGAWMIKNSWGTSWGASGPYPGCAWVAYGAANLGDETSAVCGYNNAGDTIYYHDECGWMLWCEGTGLGTTAYGAVRFTPSQNLDLTAVDFWAVDVNMSYEIKVFDTRTNLGSGNYSFSSQLGTTQSGTTSEKGYYSIPLSTPVSLTTGDDFVVQVKLTSGSPSWYWPIPIDYCDIPWLPPWSGIATFSGESYWSSDGTQFVKPTKDVGIRARGVTTYDIPLVSGWNLISLPLIPGSPNIEDVLAGIMTNVESVWAYDGATQTWSFFVPGGPPSLTEMTEGKGCWVNVTNPCVLTVEGTEPSLPHDIPLFSGWNLIGLPLFAGSTNIEDVLAGIMTDIESVWAYDGATQTWFFFVPGGPPSLTEMTEGKGYWVNVSIPCVLTIEDS